MLNLQEQGHLFLKWVNEDKLEAIGENRNRKYKLKIIV